MNSKSWLGQTTTVAARKIRNNIEYLLTSTAKLKDNFPKGGSRKLRVSPEQLQVNTGSELFDALFSLAIDEARENSVESISDWSFESEGKSVFETGKKWKYVWTRDTAYSVHLGIGIIDPIRAKNSMEFKISTHRNKKQLQIVQDTGTGGSWPLSTDRVVWALGADKLISTLPSSIAKSFEKKSIDAIENTVLIDREAIFDKEYGLYKGEQSFLDWREQTYPLWTKSDTIPIGESKALSTNVCHYFALSFLARKLNDKKYEKWASELKDAINKHFWSKEDGLYCSMILSDCSKKPLKKFDLLGNSLAVLFDVASPGRAKQVVACYPYTEAGAPVVHPQLREVPIYHNRGIWPFVSAYAMLAAKKVKNEKVFRRNLNTLMTAAAINLSNMENMEFLTLSPEFEDGENSGPVVNSQRQLWSVAAYLNTVIEALFGLELENDGLRINPFIPVKLRNYDFEAADSITLSNFNYKNKTIKVKLDFPDRNEEIDGTYCASHITVNGKKSESHFIPHKELKSHSEIRVAMKLVKASHEINEIEVLDPSRPNSDEIRKLFAPRMPVIIAREIDKNKVSFKLEKQDNSKIVVIKNGKRVPGIEAPEIEVNHLKSGDKISLIAVDVQSGNESHPTAPYTHAPSEQIIDLNSEKISIFNNRIDENDIYFTSGMGSKKPLCFKGIQVDQSGMYRLELLYRNIGPENTGITASIKWMEILTNKNTHKSICYMPHREDEQTKFLSSPVEVYLEKDIPLTVNILEGQNMSALSHFEKYQKRGGKEGADNRADIFGLKITKC